MEEVVVEERRIEVFKRIFLFDIFKIKICVKGFGKLIFFLLVEDVVVFLLWNF